MSTPLTDEIDNLKRQLDNAQERNRLLSAQHVRLCDQVYEEDGETLKQTILELKLAKLIIASYEQVEVLRVQLSEEHRDAERYQLVRSIFKDTNLFERLEDFCIEHFPVYQTDGTLTPEQFDAAIDAAISAGKDRSHE